MATQLPPITDLTKAPQQILVDLINADNGTQLTPDMLVFGTPVLLPATTTPPPPKNTQLQLQASATSGLRGSQVVFYDRIDISSIINDPTFNFGSDGISTWADLLPALNAHYNINLTVADITDAPVLNPSYGAIQMQSFAISPSALIYHGSATVPIIGNVNDGIDLSTVIKDQYLDSLTTSTGS